MTRFLFDIRKKIFDKVLRLKALFFNNIKTGEIATIINKDTEEFMNLIHWNFFYVVADIVRLVTCISIVLFLNVKVVLIMALVVPFSVFFSIMFGEIVKSKYKDYRENYGDFISWVSELLSGFNEVKFFGAELSTTKYFIEYGIKFIKLKIKVNYIEHISERTNALISLISDLTLYILSTFLIVNGNLTVGGFIAIIEYFKRANQVLKDLNSTSLHVQKNMISINRVFNILEKEEEIREGVKPCTFMGEIDLRNVSFSYANQKVIDNFDLHIKPGEKVSLVGASGAGKSTIVNLLLGFYRSNSGSISIDGLNLNSYSLDYLRTKIGVVHQDYILFNGTIRDNLKLAGNKYTDEQIWQACEKAFIADYIRELPDQLDTIIGNNGANLSGGQKQRLAIARIFLKDPKILIFDESTSALDPEAEQAILKALSEVSVDRTCIIISHRLSTVLDSNRIAVLCDGKIIAVDRHEKLVQSCPYYNQIFNNQLLMVEDRA